MATFIEAPYPNEKVTIAMPNVQMGDSRTPEHDIVTKRSMLGDITIYKKPNSNETLVLVFLISRQKSLEFEEFLRVYQSAEWRLLLYDNSAWRVKIVGEPIARSAISRIGAVDTTLSGVDQIELSLTVSGVKLT